MFNIYASSVLNQKSSIRQKILAGVQQRTENDKENCRKWSTLHIQERPRSQIKHIFEFVSFLQTMLLSEVRFCFLMARSCQPS